MKRNLTLAAGLSGLVIALLFAVVVIRAMTWSAPRPPAAPSIAAATRFDPAQPASRLSQAIQIATVSHQDPRDNDWRQWDALHAWMRSAYPAVHARLARETVAGHTLIYQWRGTDPTLAPIVLMAHQDVVPVEADGLSRWRAPPFSGRVADGMVWGRGALDDKGSLVSILEAVESLARSGFTPRRTVFLVFGHDEEAGGTGARAAAARLKAQGVKPLFVLDEGGVIIAKDPLAGRNRALIGIAEKGYANLRVSVRSQGGHSSQPPDETPVQLVGRAVDRIASDRFTPRFDGVSADTVRALADEASWPLKAAVANAWLTGPLLSREVSRTPAGAAMLRTTIAPTMMSGSPKANVLPNEAYAVVNYRIHPRDSLDAVLQRARRAVDDPRVSLTWVGERVPPGPTASTEGPGYALIAAVATAQSGARPAPFLMIGGTDGRFMTALTPNVYRFQPVVLTDTEVATMHGDGERISLENLARAIGFYARLIRTSAG